MDLASVVSCRTKPLKGLKINTQISHLQHGIKCPLIFAPYSKYVKFEQDLKGVSQSGSARTHLHTGFPNDKQFKSFPDVMIDYELFGIPAKSAKFIFELATHPHTQEEVTIFFGF